jgi:hypothetical protein
MLISQTPQTGVTGQRHHRHEIRFVEDRAANATLMR